MDEFDQPTPLRQLLGQRLPLLADGDLDSLARVIDSQLISDEVRAEDAVNYDAWFGPTMVVRTAAPRRTGLLGRFARWLGLIGESSGLELTTAGQQVQREDCVAYAEQTLVEQPLALTWQAQAWLGDDRRAWDAYQTIQAYADTLDRLPDPGVRAELLCYVAGAHLRSRATGQSGSIDVVTGVSDDEFWAGRDQVGVPSVPEWAPLGDGLAEWRINEQVGDAIDSWFATRTATMALPNPADDQVREAHSRVNQARECLRWGYRQQFAPSHAVSATSSLSSILTYWLVAVGLCLVCTAISGVGTLSMLGWGSLQRQIAINWTQSMIVSAVGVMTVCSVLACGLGLLHARTLGRMGDWAHLVSCFVLGSVGGLVALLLGPRYLVLLPSEVFGDEVWWESWIAGAAATTLFLLLLFCFLVASDLAYGWYQLNHPPVTLGNALRQARTTVDEVAELIDQLSQSTQSDQSEHLDSLRAAHQHLIALTEELATMVPPRYSRPAGEWGALPDNEQTLLANIYSDGVH